MMHNDKRQRLAKVARIFALAKIESLLAFDTSSIV
jgi:hypothetical protein